MKRIIRLAAAALLLAFAAGSSLAQTYPAKPVRIIVPFPPGGGVDVVARTFSQKFSEFWGQQAVVENRPGAGGNIAADLVAKAPPDGYTLLITTTGHAVAPSLFRKLPFDPFKDFAAVSQITSTYLVLVANPAMPATLKELIALAKAQPGKLNYAHTGLGVAPHIVGEMLKAGFDRKTVERVIRLVDSSEYKRRQAPPGVKITPRGLGKDRRFPITNRYKSY